MDRRRKTNRREFFKGKSALETLADSPEGGDASGGVEAAGKEAVDSCDPSVGTTAKRSFLFQISRSAMACRFQVYLNAGQHAEGPEAAVEALDLVDALEDQMTVFRDHSEISLINQNAAHEAVRVESRLFALLELAVELSEITHGAFDITAGPLAKVWGFRRRRGRFPSQPEVEEALRRVGYRWLQLDPHESTVRFVKPGVEIDLGAIGKGYALDRCSEHFSQASIHNYVVHGGQSSVLARGSRAGRADNDAGWTVALRHPLRANQGLAEIRLRDRALGTSGSGNQFFHHKGRRFGHVVDPRTGWPAEGVLSCTVLAPTAAVADALATAFFVMGVEQTRDFCQGRDDLAALLVCPGGRSGAIELYAIGLDDSDWARLG